MRRFITRADIQELAPGAELALAPDDVATPSALEEAALRGVRLRQGTETPAAAAPPDPVGERGGRVIVTGVGLNHAGVLAELTGLIGELGGNIQDISQRIVQEYYSLFMVVDLDPARCDMRTFKQRVEALSREGDQLVSVHHESIFRAMHRIDTA